MMTRVIHVMIAPAVVLLQRLVGTETRSVRPRAGRWHFRPLDPSRRHHPQRDTERHDQPCEFLLDGSVRRESNLHRHGGPDDSLASRDDCVSEHRRHLAAAPEKILETHESDGDGLARLRSNR
jgi:hypothetical protein